ncbi:MAG: serine/threonine protein kinase [Mariniblastus sp.]|nr:serine/threonine protein kinase [Mariniblastus sp.]
MKIKKLGPYKLLSILGRGGMGTVYRAKNNKTGNFQAVKVLAPYYVNDPHFRTRFESEIKALIKLDHPNIVRLISYGQEDTNLFFAMELVEGKSLFQLQRDGKRFDWREVLSISRDIATGLRHAHDRGVIHRDLKPGNLLASNDGLIKITDFGIAKNYGANSNTGNNVLGTMDFMSPEQAQGQPVTVKSDLYSLGAVMYCLLSGHPPNKGKSVEESIHNLTRAPTPHIIRTVPEVPPELDELISHLMERDPAKRLPTAQALLHQIESVEQQLKYYSEAKTAERPPVASHDTFDIRTPVTAEQVQFKGSSENTELEDGVPGTSVNKKLAASPTQADTSVEMDGPIQQDSGAHIDYFNTVTEQQRQRHSSRIKDETSWKGVVLTGVPLLVLVLVLSFFITQALKRPSAEQLYATIIRDEDNPQKAREEIEQFLEFYPDNEFTKHVKELSELADAIALKQRLTVQANASSGSPLTNIESQFVEIMKLSRKDSAAAYTRLSALVTLYDGDEALTPEDTETINAAQTYLPQLKQWATEQRSAMQEKIEAAMKRAKSAPPDEAAKLYRSIIELYGESPWAQPLIEPARQRLQESERNGT